MIKKQFTIYLENKPGELARVSRFLKTAKINIEGISVSASTDIGLVQIVPSNAANTRKVLNKAKVAFTVQDVALVPLENKPGALADIASRMARDGVNINYIYATGCTCKDACGCYAVISAPDLPKAEKAFLA